MAVPLTLATCGYLLWLGFIFNRLLTTSMPRPSDVMLLSLFFYNFPLALIASIPELAEVTPYLVFLNPIASDAEIAETTIALTILASISVATGRWMSGRFMHVGARKHSVLASISIQRAAAKLSILFLLTIAIGVALFGFESFFAGYAVESNSDASSDGIALIFFAYEAIGLCAFIWYCGYRHTGKRIGMALMVIAMSTIIAITLTRGKRLELIIALLPLLLVLWSTRLLTVKARATTIVIIVVTISALASIRQGELPDASSIAFNFFSEGLYAGHVTPGVIDALEAGQVKAENGLRFVAALAAFVPRFVFPQKDDLIYESLTDMKQFAPLGATSMLAEILLQGGATAVVVSFAFLGWLARRLEIPSLLRSDGRIELRTVLYILFVCSFVLHFRDGIITSTKIPLQLLVVFFIVLWLGGMKLQLRPIRSNGNSSKYSEAEPISRVGSR